MPYVDNGLPYNGSVPLTRHTSRQGAEAAAKRATPQLVRYLILLRDRYPHGLTDAEAADLLEIDRSTVNARRAQCESLVEACGTRPGKHDVANVIWRWKGKP